MHLVTQKDMCDGNSRCVFVDQVRARARALLGTPLQSARRGWSGLFLLRKVGHPSHFFILSAMHLITEKDMCEWE